MSHVTTFDEIVAALPSDWSLAEIFVALDDPIRLTEARVALARSNPRPLFGEGDHDFAITIANTHGRGAHVGVARSALSMLDDFGITGRLWGGTVHTSLRPAPAHRYGP